MLRSKLCLLALILLAALLAATAPSATAQPERAPIKLYLRRSTFDPLRAAPAVVTTLQADPASRLALTQFDSTPTAETRGLLERAGAHPLLYIPDNGLLVRLVADARPAALRALPGLRWYGLFQAAYKLAEDLDSTIGSTATDVLDLRMLAAPDADVQQLARDLPALGGAVLGHSVGLNGIALRVRLPARALRQIVRRDDILWAERFVAPRVLNDQARDIVGVTAARQQLGWLTGAGQSVAITDTGLDVQSSVLANANPDFPASRIAAAFAPAQVDRDCATNPEAGSWSDQLGHGTHVAGTVLGSGARSPGGLSFAGVAPETKLVLQGVQTSAGAIDGTLDCLAFDSTFLAQAYAAGARVHNASWGAATGTNSYGAYTQFSSDIDDFLWQHPDDLFVVAAGNDGADSNPRDGVVDADSIEQPGTAKNVLTVGASENNRPPTSASCGSSAENSCWSFYSRFRFTPAPLPTDFVSDNINGMAAFSSRGPTDDGRIKPEIVAPGTNIISAASQYPGASYEFRYPGGFYAYDSGTSMSAPVISGMAALVRQWLMQARQISSPSAALVKALLLNGTTNISPGQYGTGAAREIPAAWPNSVEGWGRAALPASLGLDGAQVWIADGNASLSAQGALASYSLIAGAGQPLRLTLVWTDYPGSPQASRALVNDLDLEVQAPDGTLLRGNAAAALGAGCRDEANGADRCNNVESVEIAAPLSGLYVVRVRAAKLPQPGQSFALVGRAQSLTDRPLASPTLQAIAPGGGAALHLSWNAVDNALFYTIEQSTTSDFTAISGIFSSSETSAAIVEDIGTYWFRVRACTRGSCSAPGNARSAQVSVAPKKNYLPVAAR